MKKLFLLTSLLSILLISACSNTSVVKDGEWPTVDDPFKELSLQANTINDEGGAAVVVEAVGSRIDIAREKARAMADGALAELFEKKISRLRKNFLEEVGQGKQAEVNELFFIVQQSFTQKVLRGVVERDYKMLTNNKGLYRCGVLMVVSPKTVNMSMMDEMQSSQHQLYQRFRASKAFEELQKEIEAYEKKEKENR